VPIVPIPAGNPYPTINEVMNIARARVNDMMNDAIGDELANDVPASQVYLSAAWKWFQSRCDTAGVQPFTQVAMLYGIPARASNDLGNECSISWAACSDGVNTFGGPLLPQDMIAPKSVWRRQYQQPDSNGAQTLNSSPLCLMTQAPDGLPVWMDTNTIDIRDDAIYFYGELYAQDWKFRYSAYRPALDITQPTAQIPMMMCEDCLGARIAFEFASARGAVQAPAMEAWAETAFNTVTQRAARIKMRQTIRRRGYTGRNTFTRTYPNIQ
jgi:hypothetical protein